MDGTKPWWQSLGVWGTMVAMASTVVSAAGYTISPDDQAQLAQGLTQAGGLAASAVTLVSSALALYGRIRATKKIG